MSSAKSKSLNAQIVSPEAWKQAWEQSIAFTSGTGVIYEPSMLTDETTPNTRKLASNIVIGKVGPVIVRVAQAAYLQRSALRKQASRRSLQCP